MTRAFSWQNIVSLCCASLCTPRPNLPVTPGISWYLNFAFQLPMVKKTSFFPVVQEGLVGPHRAIQLQLKHLWLGSRLGLLWYWMVCLGNELRSFCYFWDCIQVLHFGLFCWLWGLLSLLPINQMFPKFYFCPLKTVLQLPIKLMNQRKAIMLSYFVTFKRNVNDIFYLNI